jgi:hypothetical protein
MLPMLVQARVTNVTEEGAAGELPVAAQALMYV